MINSTQSPCTTWLQLPSHNNISAKNCFNQKWSLYYIVKMEVYVCVHMVGDKRTKCSSFIVGSQEIISKTDFKNSSVSILPGIEDKYQKKPLKEFKVFALWKWEWRGMRDLHFKPFLF